jgi:hypothetical protein
MNKDSSRKNQPPTGNHSELDLGDTDEETAFEGERLNPQHPRAGR